MPTAVVSELLRTLHRIHTQLSDLRGRIAAGPRQVAAHTAQVEAAEAARTGVQDDVKKAKMAADQKQLQLKSAESKIRDLDGKLNTCKTNREYQLLTEQIAADRMAMKVLEDEILEALERIDAVRQTLPAAEAAVRAAGTLLADARARVAAEAGELEAEVIRLRGDLERAERDLPADVRDLYDRAVKHKGADGMAPLDGESCGGCFRQLTGNMYSDLLLGKMVMCRSCGRLLYMPERSAAG
ncbi:MAG: phospholipase [Planctomycetia bacterium]|nr:phospholipase [Planctomycetia bacterium]